MNTQCTSKPLQFHPLGRRRVTGRFDGGRISSDAGGLLLREIDRHISLTARVAECFADYRNPNSVEHPVVELLTQRIYAMPWATKTSMTMTHCAMILCFRCWRASRTSWAGCGCANGTITMPWPARAR